MTMMASAAVSIPNAKADGTPTLAVSKVYEMNEVGTTFRVNITVANVDNMRQWMVCLKWDPTILNVTTGDTHGWYYKRTKTYYNVYKGSLMNSSASTFWMNGINLTEGSITALTSFFNSESYGVKGSGVIAVINFTLLRVGTSIINVTSSDLQHPRLVSFDNWAVVNGLVTDQPPPPWWMDPGFQMTVLAVAVAVTVPSVTIFTLTRKPVPTEAQLKKIREFTEKEAEGKPLPKDSEKT
jgi:hypothetical protein